MFSFFKTGLLALSVLRLVTGQQYSYWLDDSCRSRVPEGGGDSIASSILEVRYHAGNFADALERGDNGLDDILKWNFGITTGDVLLEKVINKYRIMSQLIENVNNRKATEVRIYCNNQARIYAVSDTGTQIPFPTTEEGRNAVRFYDPDNDAVYRIVGTCMYNNNDPVAVNNNQIGDAFALTLHKSLFEQVTGQQSDHNPARATIDFCTHSWTGPGKPFTYRDLADKELEGWDVRILNSLASHTLTHELTHVPVIGTQTFTINGQPIYFAKALDAHGIVGDVNGYYRSTDQQMLSQKLQNNVMYAITNSDSYAYALGLYILRTKQWRSDWDAANSKIVLHKDASLPLGRDWDQ